MHAYIHVYRVSTYTSLECGTISLSLQVNEQQKQLEGVQEERDILMKEGHNLKVQLLDNERALSRIKETTVHLEEKLASVEEDRTAGRSEIAELQEALKK